MPKPIGSCPQPYSIPTRSTDSAGKTAKQHSHRKSAKIASPVISTIQSSPGSSQRPITIKTVIAGALIEEPSIKIKKNTDGKDPSFPSDELIISFDQDTLINELTRIKDLPFYKKQLKHWEGQISNYPKIANLPSVAEDNIEYYKNKIATVSNLELSEKDLKKLEKLNIRFGGLCEIMCNQILKDDLLGKGKAKSNYLHENVQLKKITKDNIHKSHMLEVYSFIRRIIAVLFGYYPDNIFSYRNQRKLVQKSGQTTHVNREILKNGLKTIDEGETLKLEVFSQHGFNLEGHSLLVKKTTEDDYIFFDPNFGEYRNLSIEGLGNKIDKAFETYNGTNILLMRGKDYLQRLQNEKIIRIANAA